MDFSVINEHKPKLQKKLRFLRKSDDVKFKSWRPKSGTLNSQRSPASYRNALTRRKTIKKIKRKKRALKQNVNVIERQAEYALRENIVINFTDETIPASSVAFLSYDKGFIPSPTFDSLKFRMDGYNFANKLAWKYRLQDIETEQQLPWELLKKPLTAPCQESGNRTVNTIRSDVINFCENLKPSKARPNLNILERQGLKWLKDATRSGKIAVTTADKGGATLIMHPHQIWSSTESRLADTSQFENLGTQDPTPCLRDSLLSLWKKAWSLGFVTDSQAEKTVGLKRSNDRFTLSTNDIFKPSTPYAYPLYKVHKLNDDQLSNKTIPPARLVTDLSRGLTARSDKFIAWKWLTPLAAEYAVDLVRDSTQALQKLEAIESSGAIHNEMFGFNMDVVALYDSLSHTLILEAIDDAINSHRPEWTSPFRTWLKDMVSLSFKSAVLKNKDDWFLPIRGIPTGGCISVEVANLAVYFALKNLLYSRQIFDSAFPLFIRFIDDTTGIWTSQRCEFISWFDSFRSESVNRFGLDFTYTFNNITSYTQFLDIQYTFKEGKLTTDLFKKPTDANRYLHYKSYHPRHLFKNVVYSQAIRYRRIISDNETFSSRLNDLSSAFVTSGYPPQLVEEVINRVKDIPRDIRYRSRTCAEDTSRIVPWVVNFGPGYSDVRREGNRINNILSNLTSNANPSDDRLTDTTQTNGVNCLSNVDITNPIKIRVSYRRDRNTKDLLFRRKALTLPPRNQVGPDPSQAPSINSRSSPTVPCTDYGNASQRGRICLSCSLMSRHSEVKNNNKTVLCSGGNCKSASVVYAAQCSGCPRNNTYIGKTVNELRLRINGHRSSYYNLLRLRRADPEAEILTDDQNCLGAHLVLNHGAKSNDEFNKYFRFTILKAPDPINLRACEQSFIESLHTLIPFGFNSIRSIGG